MKLFCTYIVTAAATAAITAGCSSSKGVVREQTARDDSKLTINLSENRPTAKPRPTIPSPDAILYKTTGDYRKNVPIKLNNDGTLQSYPAPTDIPANPEAIEIKDGWFLSPLGVTANTVFTEYTLEEYRMLPSAPTADTLLKAVIPGSKVTATVRIAMTTAEAIADPKAAASAIPVLK